MRATAFLLYCAPVAPGLRCADFVHSRFPVRNRGVEIFAAALLGLALAGIQVLVGGTRLLFSLPAYSLVAVAGLVSLLALRRGRPAPDQLCLGSAVIFFGYIIGRGIFSPVVYLARVDIYSVLGGLLVYFLVATVLTSAKTRGWLLFFLLLVACVHVGIGAVQFRYDSNFMLISWLQRFDYGRRASGFYACPNHLAGFLEVIAIFGLSLVCWGRWPVWSKLLILYAVAVCYLGQALTGSRGGYLSVVASLIVFGVLSLIALRQTSPSLFWKACGVSLVGAIAAGALALSLLHRSDYLTDRANNVIDKGNIRLLLWEAAVDQWKLEPIFGTGSGTYRYYGRQFRRPEVLQDPIYVHNDYLQLLAEYGVIGAATFLFFAGCHLRRGWLEFQRLGPKRMAVSARLLSNGLALNLGAIAALAAYLVHSVFDFNLHIPANVLLLAFVFGVLANSGWPREAAIIPPPQRAQVLWRLVLPLIALIVLAQSARLLPGEYLTERARTALRDHHPASAIYYALQGLEVENKNPNLYEYLGRARLSHAEAMANPQAARSFYRDALEPFQAALALAPNDETFVLDVGFALDGQDRFAEADPFFRRALQLDPNSRYVRKFYEAHLDRWRQEGSKPQAPKPPAPLTEKTTST